MSLNFCFLGAGNLATHLSKSLKEKGFNIIQVYSKTNKSAKTLADVLNSDYTTSPAKITINADVYFVALKDAVFDEVLSKINLENKLVVHCSGSLPVSVLSAYSDKTGVFYPLQTFSKQRDVDFHKIPVFVEANSEEIQNKLIQIAEKISDSVTVLESAKRKYLHIAAVFACNFVNHFYTISAEILKTKDIPFEVLQPLILETALKVQEIEPEKAQTGPAVRFDENIISDHLNEIKDLKNYAELYNSISKSIFEHHQNLK
ncbi:DUF2520 domain-containing protein [Maribellus comscasis]|uniref:DUF2520 domain-containing protein n=1 Tax=Maribellus comscasis TaxID=2681766 RepID=A0A6I6JX80_9BACT|nr:Rossmann-like and DUF2520 domain-containing protein [Maribellus comscasis]QGY45949.1 DUF2520 domain-containing protein [Maribellus comscasis]